MDKVETKVKRPRTTPTQRWSETQTRELIQAVVDAVKENVESFEKPTAQRFYESVSKKSALLTNLTWIVMKSKMRHLKSSFVSAVSWKSQTGAGLMEVGKESSVQEYVNKICPYFDLLQQIFGQRKNVVLSNMYSTSNDVQEVMECETFVINEANEMELEDQLNTENILPTFSHNVSNLSQKSAKSRQKAEKKTTHFFSSMVELQEKKLELELKKFEWEQEKEKSEIELKKMKMQQELEIKKLELEMNERIEREKLRLQHDEKKKCDNASSSQFII